MTDVFKQDYLPSNDNAVSEMIAKLVHKLRNPLSSIKMGLTTLLHRSKLNEKDTHCLEVASREVVYIENILKDLLGFVKPYVLHFSEQNINNVIELALEEISEGFNQNGIVIHKQLNDHIPKVILDVGKVTRALVHVFRNSQDAMIANGEMRIHSDYGKKDNAIIIEIKDSGPGIGVEELKQVFEPFFSTKTGSTGLGMTIVQKIIKAHGGSIDISSTLGEGTRTRITLPID
jgi:signal transduction histidine kinase